MAVTGILNFVVLYLVLLQLTVMPILGMKRDFLHDFEDEEDSEEVAVETLKETTQQFGERHTIISVEDMMKKTNLTEILKDKAPIDDQKLSHKRFQSSSQEKYLACLEQTNMCLREAFGGKLDFSKFYNTKQGGEIFAHNLLVSILESFYDDVHTYGFMQIENACESFKSFRRCADVVSKSIGKAECFVTDQINIYLNGMINYICKDGSSKFYRFVQSRCLEFQEDSDWSECESNIVETKMYPAIISVPVLMSHEDIKVTEVVLQHFICLVDIFVSCVESVMDDVCADSHSPDVWVTMFNKGSENILQHYSLPNFIPNKKSCGSVERQFFELVKKFAGSGDNIFTEASDVLSKNSEKGCGPLQAMTDYVSCFLPQYPQILLHIAQNPNDVASGVEAYCQETSNTFFHCIEKYHKRCPDSHEVDFLLDLVKDGCNFFTRLRHSHCSWDDISDFNENFKSIEERICKNPLSQALLELQMLKLKTKNTKMMMLHLYKLLNDKEMFRCYFKAIALAVDDVEETCGTEVAKPLRMLYENLNHNLDDLIEMGLNYLTKSVGSV